MSAKRWTLASRLIWVISLFMVGIVVPLTAGSFWLLWHASERSLDQLLQEELGEMASRVERTSIDTGRFVSSTEILMADHPTFRFGWRLWDASGERVLAESGSTTILRRAAPDPGILDLTSEAPGDLRWRSMRMPDGHTVALVLDGSPKLSGLRTSGAIAAALVSIGLMGTILAALLYSRRIASLLTQVGERARVTRGQPGDGPPPALDLPEEIRPVAQAFQTTLENLRTESEKSRVMIAGLAHELRSPLQNLVGETEIALLTEGGVAEYRATLQSNLIELQSLGDAVDNLVTLCSASEASASVQRERFDLAEEAELRLARDRTQAAHRGVRVLTEASGDTTIEGDREWLLRAIRNLTCNAVDWSPAGADVLVSIRGRGAQVHVSVDDAGPGIPDELRDDVFLPFFRGPQRENTRTGYGLGLAIVRVAVEAHRGTVELSRSERGGAHFDISLPRTPRSLSQDIAPQANN